MQHSEQSLLLELKNNPSVALIYPYEPTKIIVMHKDKPITQHQFLCDLQRLIARLPNAQFALNMCDDRYYFMLGFCALLVKGCVNLLPPNRQPSTLMELAQDYPDCYCLYDQAIPCDLPSVHLPALLETELSDVDTVLNAPPDISAQQVAAIAFTSGSTGKPKPNLKAWGTLAATARLLGQRIGAHSRTTVIVATVPSQHMYGLESTLMMALQAGAIMHSAKPFYPADVQQLLTDIALPSLLLTTPTHLRAIVNAELAMPRLSGIISATAALDTQVALASEACFNTELWEIYGCTEAGAMATRRSTQTQTWTLLEGFELMLCDESITARAPHIMDHAPIQDQLTLLDKRNFLLHGRDTDMINVAGKRSSLAHLSVQLLRIEGVKDGVFFLPPVTSTQSQRERRPVALVVSDLSEKEILTALAEHIDPVFLPRPLRKISALPRNETGKITAATLHSLWSQSSE